MNLPLVLWEKLDWPRFDCVNFITCSPSVLTFRSYFSFLLIIHQMVQLRFTCLMFTLYYHKFITFYKPVSINSTRQNPCYGRIGFCPGSHHCQIYRTILHRKLWTDKENVQPVTVTLIIETPQRKQSSTSLNLCHVCTTK